MRKFFTFLCAALMSVGMYGITVTWDAATIAALNLEAGDEFTKDNIKLKVNSNAYVENGDFEGSSSNAFTFSLTNDQFFHSIVVTCSSSNADAAGWKESGTTVTWAGNAASVVYGDDFTGVSSIVFTIGPWVLEGDVWDEATKTLTVNSNPGEAAYLGRTEIEHLIISNAVTSIGISAFKSCTNLSSVTFGNSVESIGLDAFSGCSNLASIELPASIQSIDNYAFMYCSQLASLTCNAVNPPTIGNALFFGWGALAHIYVPAGSVDDYKGATGWSAKASIIEAIPGDEPEPASDGKLSGGFTINASGDQISFSKGNLQATTTDNGANWTWEFAANQWDYVGNAAANNAINGNKTVSANGSVDLFGWSTAATYYGINNSDNPATYSGAFVDWGATIGAGWRTLSTDEWAYLFNTRTNASSKYGMATVANMHGVIILPDVYEGTAINANHSAWNNNIISAVDWEAYEAAGAVFLPTPGYRDVTTTGDDGSSGYYWASTASGNDNAFYLVISSNDVSVTSSNRNYGQSVRLVTAYVAPTPEPTAVENVQTNHVQAIKFLRDGMLLIEKNGKLYNATGAEVR